MSEQAKVLWPGWETVRLIGHGSFGAVYEIEREVFGHKEKAALKVITIPQSNGDIDDLLNDGYDEESITARFAGYLQDIVREYSLMADMKGCANIVYCDDVKYVQHDNGIGWDIFIKMELLTALPKALGKSVAEEQVVKIGSDICSALAFCEKRNLLHRDIKPQNIFVSSDGTYKLGDFGIAKTAERTTSGTKTGTYKYMAPEVYNNRPYGAKADIYSLGLVLYWLLNERRTPFLPLPPAMPTSSDEDKARARRFAGEPIPAPAHGSEELKRIVLKACAYEAKDRYQNAEEMLEDLRALGGAQPTPVTAREAAAAIPVTAKGEDASAADDGHAESTVGVFRRAGTDAPEDATSTDASSGTVTERDTSRKAAPAAPVKEKKKSPRGLRGAVIALVLAGAALFFLWPRYGEWSDWSTEEPEHLSGRRIETATEYRSREQILLSTDKRSEVVGEVDHEEIGYGNWGEWSDWQEEELTSTDGVEVEEGIQYRFREKEYTTSTETSIIGWTQYDSKEEPYWEDWSRWSTSEVTASDSRQVETSKQYRYRDKEFTTSSSSSLSGWTKYDTKTDQHWGDWSAWIGQATPSATRQVQTRWYIIGTYSYINSAGEQTDSGYLVEPHYEYSETDPPYQYQNQTINYPDGSKYQQVEIHHYSQRYRDLVTTYTYYYYRWGSWASWSSNSATKTNNRDVQSQTVYRYRDQKNHTMNYYWQWGSWSEWSLAEKIPSEETEVETRTVFRSRKGEKVPIYCYYDWSEWSGWSFDKTTETDNREVEERTVYRFKDQA